jgi:hypothetical protein
MPNATLVQVMKEQFGEAFDILAAAIPAFAPEEWRTGRSPFDGPARGVGHALQCAEYYTSPSRAIFGNLGKPIWQMGEEDLPDQPSMGEYLERTRSMTMAWIDEIDEIGFAQPSGTDDAIGLGRLVYALRHLQHHTGEVCAYQKQFGHPQKAWD